MGTQWKCLSMAISISTYTICFGENKILNSHLIRNFVRLDEESENDTFCMGAKKTWPMIPYVWEQKRLGL